MANNRNGSKMTKRFFNGRLKALSASILVSTLWFAAPTPSHAKLADELEGMFANVTAGGSFQTALRSGWAGGGIGVRGPIKNVNIISFDPPRLSAGCGGIDLFGGSFSFINSDQLIALFRAIAQNAIGVAFKAAIDAINPFLGRLMQDFQALVQALNLGNANTCAIASSIVNSAASWAGIDLTTRASTTGEKTALGRFADSLASYTEGWFNNAQPMTKEAAADEKFPEIGNLTWKALGRSKTADYLPNPITGETDSKANKEFLLSVLGTLIIGTEPSTSSSTSDGRSASPTPANFPPVIDLSILRQGVQNENDRNIKMYRCEEVAGGPASTVPDGACDKIRTENVGADFRGIMGYVSNMLLGQPDGIAGGTMPNSIVQKIYYCTDSVTASCSLTLNQRYFLNAIQSPALTMLMKASNDPNLMTKVASDLIPIIADQFYVSYLTLFEQAARLAYAGEGQQPTPQWAEQVITSIQTLQRDAREDLDDHIPRLNELSQYLRNALGDYDAPYPFAGIR